MYYQSKKTIEWKKNDYTRTILLFALHTFIIVLLYGVMLFWNAYRAEVDTAEFLMKKETISKLLYVAIAVVLLAAGIYLYFFNENKEFYSPLQKHSSRVYHHRSFYSRDVYHGTVS